MTLFDLLMAVTEETVIEIDGCFVNTQCVTVDLIPVLSSIFIDSIKASDDYLFLTLKDSALIFANVKDKLNHAFLDSQAPRRVAENCDETGQCPVGA